MHGSDAPQTALFSYLTVEDRIPAGHPLAQSTRKPIQCSPHARRASMATNAAMGAVDSGRRLRRAPLLQILVTIRSEHQLMTPLNAAVLFRWEVGLNANGNVWVPTVSP